MHQWRELIEPDPTVRKTETVDSFQAISHMLMLIVGHVSVGQMLVHMLDVDCFTMQKVRY